MRGNTSIADITIVIVRPTWKRELSMKAWTKGEYYSMILITSPAREKRDSVFKANQGGLELDSSHRKEY